MIDPLVFHASKSERAHPDSASLVEPSHRWQVLAVAAVMAASIHFGLSSGPATAQPTPPDNNSTVVYEGHPSALESPSAKQNAPAPEQEIFPGSSTAIPLDDPSRTASPAPNTPTGTAANEVPDLDDVIKEPDTAEGQAEPTQTAAPTKPAPRKQARRPFTVATWSGAYGQAQKAVVVDRFGKTESVEINIIQRRDTSPDELSSDTASPAFDAVEVSAIEADVGCRTGRLVELAQTTEQIIQTDAGKDFLDGSLKPCGIGSFAWSQVIAVNPNAFKKRKPQNLSDVFNVKRFPGKRAFIKQPRFLLESALMADGAAPREVYDLLGTQEGRERALKKLDGVFSNIIWVDDSAAALRALASGKASIAQTFSGKAFFAAARGTPLEIIWDGQIYTMTYWAIPKGSEKRELARKFLSFATEPQQLAAVAQRFPYGPIRKSAVALTKRHQAVGMDLDRFLPTRAENMKSALAANDAWWSEYKLAVTAEFEAWLAKPRVAKALPAKKKKRRKKRRRRNSN